MNVQVCAAAVGLMGDLCRALGVKVLPYCDETMVMLLENLGVCMNACVVLTLCPYCCQRYITVHFYGRMLLLLQLVRLVK